MAYPKHIQRMAELVEQLPGIGPRQALRLAFTLAEKNISYRREFTDLMNALDIHLGKCVLCFRVMENNNTPHCVICSSSNRDTHKILVVEKEQDIEQIEHAGTYDGLYHVTGGVVSPIDKNPGEKLRLRELFSRIKDSPTHNLFEVIIATSNTMEGNQTGNYIERVLQPLNIKITRLGRGLSTGAEIEYADPLTLEAALKNRQ
jgi:recombination protein RecR